MNRRDLMILGAGLVAAPIAILAAEKPVHVEGKLKDVFITSYVCPVHRHKNQPLPYTDRSGGCLSIDAHRAPKLQAVLIELSWRQYEPCGYNFYASFNPNFNPDMTKCSEASIISMKEYTPIQKTWNHPKSVSVCISRFTNTIEKAVRDSSSLARRFCPFFSNKDDRTSWNEEVEKWESKSLDNIRRQRLGKIA